MKMGHFLFFLAPLILGPSRLTHGPATLLRHGWQICPGWPDPTSPSLATNYSNADLPDLRTLLNGSTVVATGPLWDARKAEIGRLLQVGLGHTWRRQAH